LGDEGLYLAPLSLEQPGEQHGETKTLSLRKGETKTIDELEVTFVDFDFPVDQKAAMLEGREVRIGAELVVREYGKKPAKVIPAKVMAQGNAEDEPAVVGDKYRLTIVSMKPDRENKENSRVEIGFAPLNAGNAGETTDVLIVEASIKPFINLVWSGVIILLVGFLVTVVRRAQEARGKAQEG